MEVCGGYTSGPRLPVAEQNGRDVFRYCTIFSDLNVHVRVKNDRLNSLQNHNFCKLIDRLIDGNDADETVVLFVLFMSFFLYLPKSLPVIKQLMNSIRPGLRLRQSNYFTLNSSKHF